MVSLCETSRDTRFDCGVLALSQQALGSLRMARDQRQGCCVFQIRAARRPSQRLGQFRRALEGGLSLRVLRQQQSRVAESQHGLRVLMLRSFCPYPNGATYSSLRQATNESAALGKS